MTELFENERRTHYCGQLRESDIEKKVCVMGWVQKQRDLGSLIFIDLRDRTGLVQLAFDEESKKEIFDKAFKVRAEYVLCVKGVVRERASKNPNIPTGNIEVFAESLKILAVSETPPFDIAEDTNAKEELRLKYRYLDLRRPNLQRSIMFRHKTAKITRDYFDENGFIEIETPILIKSTPEGARDYLVPSRVHKGSFYALPQSPQLYKQLCMVAGFDRYMQLARCFRDEDLRADRQPEFTQIDLEMSFVNQEDVLGIVEGYIKRLFKETLDINLPIPLPRYTYTEVMERFGTDKPDMRFGMEIVDFSDILADCGFSVFENAIKNGGSVRGFTIKGRADTVTRKTIDKFTEYIKGCGAKGLAWVRRTDQTSSSFLKFLNDDTTEQLLNAADCKQGDIMFVVADSNTTDVLTQLGQLRVEVANKLDIEKNGYRFIWVVEIPYFEYDREKDEWVAMHHPFTAPLDESVTYLDSDKANIKAKAYDLVLNGIELASGSIRITNPALQSKIFDMLGLTEQEAKEKFGFLLDAFRYGPPPHGGIGIGLDRLVMQMINAGSLRDVVAFPKVQNASELMTNSPAKVPTEALDELDLTIKENS